jgi:hypothetical protein
LGLGTRKYSLIFPPWIQLYAGDTIWALMVYILFGMVFNKQSPFRIATMAIAFSFCIEFSQFYHAPWIDNIRSTRLGGLVLGYGFLWSDLVCYTIGIIIGYLSETISHTLKNKAF